jgi:hypothetical protein
VALACAAGHAARACGLIHGWINEPLQQEEISPIGTDGRSCSSLRPVRKHSAENNPKVTLSFTAAGEETAQGWASDASAAGARDVVRLTVSSRRLVA